MCKMIRMLLIAAFAVAILPASADSYLYWMIDPSLTLTDKGVSSSFSGTYNIRIQGYDSDYKKATGEGSTLTLYYQDENGTMTPWSSSSVTVGSDSRSSFAGISSSSELTYYIELYSDTFYARSEDGLSYSAAVAAGYIYDESVYAPGSGWELAQFTTAPVPEPNSAVLMLLGFAALGLKRKRKAA